jgi:3-deoxy-manno-octulosonate cytidylyltransferase (CMP-KDO synthetase)
MNRQEDDTDRSDDIRVLAVIPARYASSRFPGKPLAPISGRPMIQWVYESAKRAKRIDRLIVATDDERIADTVENFGGEVALTRPECETGTDRCAEVAASVPCEIVIDIQGDEPLIQPDLLDRLVEALVDSPWADIATPVQICRSRRDYLDPACVKVAVTPEWRVLYFTRSPVPHGLEWNFENAFIHIGVYIFRRDSLLRLAKEPRSRIEKLESLEQMRALENGMSVRGVLFDGVLIGVDHPEDVRRVEEWITRSGRRK